MGRTCSVAVAFIACRYPSPAGILRNALALCGLCELPRRERSSVQRLGFLQVCAANLRVFKLLAQQQFIITSMAIIDAHRVIRLLHGNVHSAKQRCVVGLAYAIVTALDASAQQMYSLLAAYV